MTKKDSALFNNIFDNFIKDNFVFMNFEKNRIKKNTSVCLFFIKLNTFVSSKIYLL